MADSITHLGEAFALVPENVDAVAPTTEQSDDSRACGALLKALAAASFLARSIRVEYMRADVSRSSRSTSRTWKELFRNRGNLWGGPLADQVVLYLVPVGHLRQQM